MDIIVVSRGVPLGAEVGVRAEASRRCLHESRLATEGRTDRKPKPIRGRYNRHRGPARRSRARDSRARRARAMATTAPAGRPDPRMEGKDTDVESEVTTSAETQSRKRGRGGDRTLGTAVRSGSFHGRVEGATTSCGGQEESGGGQHFALGSTLYKRRTRHEHGREIARRLIDFRGFDLSEAQANDVARFIDLLPEEMEERVREVLENCVDIDDAIAKLASVKMLEQTAQCSVGDFSEATLSEAHSGLTGGERGEGERDTATATSSAPVLTLEWVNAVVNEMRSSVDMSDAQNRATRVLQTFEGAVRQRCAEQNDHSKMMKLKRENALLKRAVAIQNSRMQDLKPLQTRVGELESACAQYDERLKAAERQNYSLQVNLRLAMQHGEQSQSPFGSKNHDVF